MEMGMIPHVTATNSDRAAYVRLNITDEDGEFRIVTIRTTAAIRLIGELAQAIAEGPLPR